MLEDVSYFKDDFHANFEVHLEPAEKVALRQKEAALQKVAVVIETNLPNAGWHNGCIQLANELGLDGTITFPDGSSVDVKNPMGFMLSFKAIKSMGLNVSDANQVPITVETDNPELFWEI